MNRRLFTVSGIAAAASALLGRRPGAAGPPAGGRSTHLRTEHGDLLSVGGPYTRGEQTGVYQIGVWADDYWLIHHARLGKTDGGATTNSVERLLAIVDDEVAFAREWSITPFGGGMGLRLTRDELIELRDAIDAYL